MKIEGQHTFAASRQAVWDALMDPTIIASIMPGCDGLETVGENAYEGGMKIKVGPVQGVFKGTVELSDLDAPKSYRLHMTGKGAPGFVDGDGVLRLDESGDGTVLGYEIEAKIGGRIASVGQRLLDSSARVIARQSLEGLEARLQAKEEAAASGEPAPEMLPPSQAELAAGFAKGLLSELIPPERRPLVFGIAAVVLLGVAFLIRGCGA